MTTQSGNRVKTAIIWGGVENSLGWGKTEKLLPGKKLVPNLTNRVDVPTIRILVRSYQLSFTVSTDVLYWK